ncbi:hypothetical protein MNEG_0477 [Monoraphidium neglectum]|uniref:Uncharacterized protein n=1 Tax=Monoraphidium neglectum TaxID=145388 RepID=A0A0D2N593_9CHLO|nr:hypothetical protein MNEG_0477 [Monoraphidium neglectum]KIZ07467.1 hypothetical protein MNEG_0477 [Monoraphidium neglectum]|eukprot:XP_013906486.1 hypothetical protein MNEG_0477 [Monoraphidium neglectum]
MARLQIHPVGLAVVIFGLLSWIVTLAGVGAASYQCQTTQSYELCAKDYQWEWWSVWFEFALLLALFITCFLERSFKRGQIVFLAFFVLATMCVMLSAHNFITQVALGPINVRDIGQDSVNAAAAGFVLLGITNFVLIIVLGKDFGVPQGMTNPYQQPGAGLHAIQFQTSAPV